MRTNTTIGLDIAKSVFQVHGVDATGQVVIRRQLKRHCVVAVFQRLPPCLVGIEACASSRHWSRELQALGHKVRLIPPAYVKRPKNDATDAEAICEAGQRRPNLAPLWWRASDPGSGKGIGVKTARIATRRRRARMAEPTERRRRESLS